MREISAIGIEARRWSIIFHRKSKHLIFRLIACGHFKHCSALAWIPELSQWWIYDVGFRRTNLRVLEDGVSAQAQIAAMIDGNAVVTIDVQDELPWLRLGMFCTTAVSHLIGIRSCALRPDALYRHLLRKGGVVIDHARRCPARDPARSEPVAGAGAGPEEFDHCAAG